MSQNKKSYTIQYNTSDPSKPTFQNAGKTDLAQNDWVELHLNSAWPAGTTTTTVTFYNNKVVNGKDAKDTTSQVGTWSTAAGNGRGLSGIFDCSETGGIVTIKDVEALALNSEAKYWFEVSGAVGGTNPAQAWSVDPEVINKGRTG